MPIFIVDSNFFIEAHRATYPLDVAKSFWAKVKYLSDLGVIASIDKVKSEIYDKASHQDTLKQWCIDNLPATFFKDTTTSISEYGQIVSWANSRRNHYNPNALNKFLDAEEADAFIVAFGLANISDVVIVTHEKSDPNMKRSIKIPEPCDAFGIQYCNTIKMFRLLGETF